MKVIEHISNTKNPEFSYEIVPPARGRSIKDITEVVKKLAPFNPPWIDVTSHSSTAQFFENEDGSINKRTFRKRPGTMGICGVIQNRFKIDTVAHVLCQGFTREETEDALIELHFLGVHNALALRGDHPNFTKEVSKHRSVNNYAADLVEQLVDLKKGKFLDHIEDTAPLDFCIGVAGYPEKHFEAPSLKQDISYLKKKVDAGAEYIVTQMFFDNQKFLNFVDLCRQEGIQVPIIPGIKVIKSAKQLKTLPKAFYIDLPDDLVEEFEANPQHEVEIGKNWAVKQIEELLMEGHLNVHFYVLNDSDTISEIVSRFKK
ncbi:MAG TPA: methylenetetrahydrofolate reductase [Pseudobdellovibrionaceae bacterium]|nr:methylenetetrahydrofolate reductase [Pseudobdellovibrionaceae bacterium]